MYKMQGRTLLGLTVVDVCITVVFLILLGNYGGVLVDTVGDVRQELTIVESAIHQDLDFYDVEDLRTLEESIGDGEDLKAANRAFGMLFFRLFLYFAFFVALLKSVQYTVVLKGTFIAYCKIAGSFFGLYLGLFALSSFVISISLFIFSWLELLDEGPLYLLFVILFLLNGVLLFAGQTYLAKRILKNKVLVGRTLWYSVIATISVGSYCILAYVLGLRLYQRGLDQTVGLFIFAFLVLLLLYHSIVVVVQQYVIENV
ncbi:MAG: hypothetical protein ACMXYK_04595 [Candidatus Woesearchaeota archaeon]